MTRYDDDAVGDGVGSYGTVRIVHMPDRATVVFDRKLACLLAWRLVLPVYIVCTVYTVVRYCTSYSYYVGYSYTSCFFGTYQRHQLLQYVCSTVRPIAIAIIRLFVHVMLLWDLPETSTSTLKRHFQDYTAYCTVQ
jgi:hypothetical protein